MRIPFRPQKGHHSTFRSRASTLAVGAVAVSAALVLAGCTGTSNSSPTSSASSGPVSLTVLNQSRGSQAALEALAAKYSTQTGNKITVVSPGPADYLAKLQADSQAKTMPDLYSMVAPSDMAPFFKAGYAMNLQSELAGPWGKDFVPSIISLTTFKKGNALGIPAGTYSAHWDISAYGLLVNPANSGVDPKTPPATMTEFLSQLKPGAFSVAASLTPQLIQGYASNFMTDQTIDATFAGTKSWKTAAWKNTFQLLVDMKKAGVIADNSLPGGSTDNVNVEKSFFNSQTSGSIFDGSFGVAVAKTTAPDFTDFSSLGLPKASNGKYAPRAAGALGKGMVVNAKGAHPQQALKFLQWLTAPAQQKYFVDNANAIPTNPTLLKSGAVAPQLQGMAKSILTLQTVSSPLTTDVTSAINHGSQSLVLGEETVDQVLNDVQAAQDLSK